MVVHLSLATVTCPGAGAEWAELHFVGLGFCQVSKVEGRGRTRKFKVCETDWLVWDYGI